MALLLGLLSTIGRLGLDIDVAVEPNRVVVGGDAVGRVEVTNNRSRPTLGTRVEVPVGAGVASFEVGSLGAGERYQEPFVIPTLRRSIIPIGPARSVKGDALGIARREVVSGHRIDLYVHPRTALLPTLTAGWVRDLEGTTTQDLSNSDVAFHTLREYVPGDDRRHIHWRTTARLGTLMVRQFVDTRRTHLGLVLSSDHSDWADDDEFELGVSVLGSLGRTALMQDQEVTALSGAQPLPSHAPTMLLDALSGIEPDQDGLPPAGAGRSGRCCSPEGSRWWRWSSVPGWTPGSCERPARATAPTWSSSPCGAAPGADVTRQRIANVSLLEIGRLEDLGPRPRGGGGRPMNLDELRRRLRPSRDDLVDAAFGCSLAILGVIGFRTSFAGGEELTVGIPAVLVGGALGYVLARLRVPLLVSTAVAVVVFFVLGGPLALRHRALGGFLPVAGGDVGPGRRPDQRLDPAPHHPAPGRATPATWSPSRTCAASPAACSRWPSSSGSPAGPGAWCRPPWCWSSAC